MQSLTVTKIDEYLDFSGIKFWWHVDRGLKTSLDVRKTSFKKGWWMRILNFPDHKGAPSCDWFNVRNEKEKEMQEIQNQNNRCFQISVEGLNRFLR